MNTIASAGSAARRAASSASGRAARLATSRVPAAVFACCDPRAWTSRTREVLAAAADASGRRKAFDCLRTEFGRRREFGVVPVALPAPAPDTARVLATLGFTLSTRR